MKYIIGITASQSKSQNIINNAYIKAFTTENTTPLIIPNLFENENEIISKEEQERTQDHIMRLAKTCDALVLTGGADLSPTLINEKVTDAENFSQNRDIFERELVKWFIVEGKPILGICRGFQLLGNQLKLNNFQQDLSKTNEEHDAARLGITNRKEPIHNVHTFGSFKEWLKTKKYNLAENCKMRTNSWHHQGFTLLPKGERVLNKEIEEFIKGEKEFFEYTDKSNTKVTMMTALNKFEKVEIIMATNCVIEGFQCKELPILAFQYHPEEYKNSPAIEYFLEEFVIKIAKEQEKKEKEPVI